MTKQDYLFRYFAIIRKLRSSGEATLNEINSYLENESEFYDRPFSVSRRTFIRDLNEIRVLFNIDIRYDFSQKAYFIAEDQQSDLNNRMLESIDTINSLNMVADITQYMFFENRRAYGTHHFHGLLQAIRERAVIQLKHQKFDSESPLERLVDPYALKESKGRWYLLVRDRKDRRVKTFGLDRIHSFHTTPGRFDYPADLDVNEMFRYCFGVINPGDETPAEIILSFRPEQGKYISSYPLHKSQTVIRDTAEEFRIGLTLYITRDLVMEILSYGRDVKVIAPKRLATEVQETCRAASGLYLEE